MLSPDLGMLSPMEEMHRQSRSAADQPRDLEQGTSASLGFSFLSCKMGIVGTPPRSSARMKRVTTGRALRTARSKRLAPRGQAA